MSRVLNRLFARPTIFLSCLLAGPLLPVAVAQVSVPGNYPTIQAAINAVPSGTTINVQPGTYAEALVIADTSRSLTIRGVAGATSTVVDAAGRNTAAINVYRSTGTISIQGLTFRNGAAAGGISGGGFVIQESSPAFVNCVFEANSAFNGGGGALIASNATFTGCVIRNNQARHFGGGVYIVNGSRPVFTGCEITGNQSGTGGPGVGNDGAGGGWFSHDSSPTIRGGRISGNTSKFAAGGLFHFGTFGSPFGVSSLLIEDAEIADNTAAQFSAGDNPAEGGGMHVEDNAVTTLNRVRVLRNRANTGAGLNAFRSRYDLIDSTVEGNIAAATSAAPTTTGFGGGIATTSNHTTATAGPSVVTLTRSLVRNNQAVLAAGGIGVFGDNFSSRRAVFSMVDSVVVSNASQSQGGGIHISRADATIGNSQIIGNLVAGGAAPFGGGLLIGTNGNVAITGTTIAANAASTYGGGIFMDDSANLDMDGSRIFNNTTSNSSGFGGGGLFVGPNGSSTGAITNSIIADNNQYQIYENTCPKTRLTYTNNTITPRPNSTDVYVSACSPFQTVTSISGFNSLGNTSGNNSNLPRYAHFLAVPRLGTRFTLAWSVARATGVTIGGVGSFAAAASTADVTPGGSTGYTLTATASSANGGNYSAVGANVQYVPPPQLAASRTVDGDFDSDRRTDVTVFRPSNGTWYHLYLGSGGSGGIQFGNGADIPAPGDYDGDGRVDVAVFRPSNGVWYMQHSSTGATVGLQFGNGNDVTVPGDYDGDGRTDAAVFRPSNGVWYLRYSSTGATVGIQWGNGNDVTVPADYDGDGRTDLAVFRPSNGTWYVRYSSTGAAAGFLWGNGADLAAPGDYDGDGRADIAVFRPANGTWYLRYATGTSTSVFWGSTEDRPVPGDYDGDGRTDIAVFRPSNGTWYLLYSTGTSTSLQWGNGADVAILQRR